MDNLHQYVPVVEQEEGEMYSPIPFGGDQLTAARGLTAKKIKSYQQRKESVTGTSTILCRLACKSEIYGGKQVVKANLF